MSNVVVFAIVFGGAGLAVFVLILIKTVISPKKLYMLENLVESGNAKSVIRQAKALISRNERNSDAHWYLGEGYRLENRPDLAVVEYRYITNSGRFTSTASEAKVRKRLAEGYLKLGLLDEAQKEFIILSKIEPNDFEHFYNIAKLFEDRNLTDSAMTNYKKTVSIYPQHTESHIRMGVIFFKKQLFNEAKKALSTALKYEPENFSCYYYLGHISKASGDTESAMLQFEKALKDTNLRQKALLERGIIFIMKGDLQHAIFELERAIKLGEDDTPVTHAIRYQLASCYEANKELIRAVEQWEKIFARNPKYRNVAEKLALYGELRLDDRLKEFLTASQTKFQNYCTKIVETLGLTIQDVFLKSQDMVEIFALETQSKWRNSKKTPSVIRIFRSADPISYDVIRGLYDQMRRINAMRSICITTSKFTRSAIEFAQIRPIDLVDKDELSKLLQTIPL